MNLPILGISSKWNHTFAFFVNDLSHLAQCSQGASIVACLEFHSF